MAVLNSNLEQAFTPEAYGALVDQVLAAKSIAFQVGTVVQISNESIRFPLLVADPAVGWYAENTQITLTDPDTDEITVTPKAVKGLTQISNEAAADTNPAVANMVGNALARSIAKKVDAAFFGNTVTNGPSGLLSVAGVNEVDTTTYPFTDLDAFHQAKSVALGDGANITHFIAAPDVALALSTAKTADNSNVGLLESVNDGTLVAGVPLLVSTDVAAGNVWAVDASQIMIVQRQGTTVVPSTDAAFDYDAVQVRAVARLSWGFVNPAGITRIYDAS